MSDAVIEMIGSRPLLFHNSALVDPDNPVVKEIAAITSKRKKTEDDRRAVERLEWFGGLHVDDGQIVVPTANIRKCLIETAKATKQGKQVARSLAFGDMFVPLVYDGPRDLDELYERAEYRFRTVVGVNGSKVMRMRPQFPRWSVIAHVFVLEELMDRDDLVRLVDRAGLIEGLGDGRINGFGRFEGKVVFS